MFKSIKKLFCLLVVVLCTIIISSCDLYSGTKDPETFDSLCDELLVLIIGNDDLTTNLLFENRYDLQNQYPISTGFEFVPSLPSPSVTSILNIVAINVLLGRVKQYNYDLLSLDQKMTYNVVSNLVDNVNKKTSEMSYLSNNYLGSYLGYQAQLPLILSEYNFRCLQDLNNYMIYLEIVEETFKKYYDFEVIKADKGYGMPDFVIEKVVSQCTDTLESIDNESTFLIKVTNDKINACDFLSDEQKASFINQNLTLLKTKFYNGYKYIKDNLPSLLGKATNNMGLAHYIDSEGKELGKTYYQNEFMDVVGFDISCDDAIIYLDQKIALYKEATKNILNKIKMSNEELSLLNQIEQNEYFLMNNTPSGQLELYKELIKEDFPSLQYEPEIIVNYIDQSMQDHFSPAAYVSSPVDSFEDESIFLNPKSIYLLDDEGEITSTLDYNYLYTTLAHEGLPGHLYQNLYFKTKDVHLLRKLLRNAGYLEGWATYAENYSLNFLRGQLPDNIVDYLISSSKYKASIYARLDLGIHYNGWTKEDTFDFLKNYSNITSVSQIEKSYEQLVEIPTNYQKYFFTYLKLVDLYDLVKSTQGDEFVASDFHQSILDLGPVPLKYVEEYIYDKYSIAK